MSKLENFKGFLAPVFTKFNDDQSVNLEVIESYAQFLRSKGVSGVLVNGTTGEGMSMSVQERKQVAEKWSEVCKNFNMITMVQVSGCALVDVIELARHATLLKVDGILCLPELYFKPKNIEKLVEYLKEIATHCLDIPLYYYHIPKLTNVNLNMANFMKIANKEISSFRGIKFSASDLDEGIQCLEKGQVFLGSVTILSGAVALGFEHGIMTLLNIKPEMCFEIQKLINDGKVKEAKEVQNDLNEFVERSLKNGNSDWVSCMKQAFNEEFEELNLGKTRKPL